MSSHQFEIYFGHPKYNFNCYYMKLIHGKRKAKDISSICMSHIVLNSHTLYSALDNPNP